MPFLADKVAFVLMIAQVADEHDVQYPAASLAYYLFVSLLPLLVLALAVVSDSLALQVYDATPRILTPEARQVVYESMTVASGRAGAALFATVVLVWSGYNVTADFRTVIGRVEGPSVGSGSELVRDSVAILGSLVLAVVSIIVTGVVFILLTANLIIIAGGIVVLLVALTLAFIPLYSVPSQSVASLPEALPGAFFTALGWTGLLVGVHLYAVNAGQYALYGVLSGLILVLTSLYIAATVLLLGVVVNATLIDVRSDVRRL